MSRPATRVLALLEVLQDRGLVPAEELARRLGTDTRSIRRYVTALRELDIPVESTRGRYGGYRLARGYRLPPLMLADEEAIAVAVALTAASSRTGDAAEPSATDRALLKLNRVLPPALGERVNALVASTAVIADRRAVVAADPEVALTLAAAVRARRRVRIEHTRRGGETSTREVDPYGLVIHARRWYLVGHDHLRGDVRSYRIDRISTAAELAGRFTPPADFDPVAHVLHGLTLGAWSHRTEVWLDTDLDTARGHLSPTYGELQPCPEGGVLLVSGAEDLPTLARMLTALPWRFAVRQPDELAEAVRKHVTGLALDLKCT